jgi:hypothetical protein
MDGAGFGRLARSLASRRNMLVAALGGGLALARCGPAGAATCRPNGKKCNPHNDAACCSGVCKKRNGGHKCAPVGEAFGCTTDPASDFCASGNFANCPDSASGYCIVARKKRKQEPLCIVADDCMDCRNDADCVAAFSNPIARCIDHCHACDVAGTPTVCVLPAR